MTKRTTRIYLEIVEEDSFPTRVERRDTIETTAEQLPESGTRIPTTMLPPPLSRLSAWIKRPLARVAR